MSTVDSQIVDAGLLESSTVKAEYQLDVRVMVQDLLNPFVYYPINEYITMKIDHCREYAGPNGDGVVTEVEFSPSRCELILHRKDRDRPLVSQVVYEAKPLGASDNCWYPMPLVQGLSAGYFSGEEPDDE